MATDQLPERESMLVSQRIRAGALGLACVFLLVMLATVLLHAAGDADVANRQAAAATANGAEPDEPLATLGVAPGNEPPDGTAAPASSPAPHAAAGTAPR